MQIAHWMCDIIDDLGSAAKEQEIQQKVVALCAKFPVYAKQDIEAIA